MDAIIVLAEDQFGGARALWAAIVASALPLFYVVGLVVGSRVLGRSPRGGLTAAALLTVFFSFGLVPFWGRYLAGVDEVGVVRGFETKSRNRVSARLYRIELADGRMLEEFVENEDQGRMVSGQRVRVRGVAGIDGFERLGDEATLGEGSIFGSLFAWGALAALTIAFARVSRKDEVS
jgi:hypothetical protein